MLRAFQIAGLVCWLVLPVAAQAANWKMRPAESSITITATQQGAAFNAQFKTFDTDITFDSADLAHSSVVATIDIASFNSDSPDRDGRIPGSDWFNISKFATARFATKSFKDLGGGKYEAVADLTIRDITKEVVLPFTLSIAGNVAHMDGGLSVQRTDYGVGQGEWATSDWVGRDVKVAIKLVADRSR